MKTRISCCIDDDVLAEIRRDAAEKDLPYQTLLNAILRHWCSLPDPVTKITIARAIVARKRRAA